MECKKSLKRKKDELIYPPSLVEIPKHDWLTADSISERIRFLKYNREIWLPYFTMFDIFLDCRKVLAIIIH